MTYDYRAVMMHGITPQAENNWLEDLISSAGQEDLSGIEGFVSSGLARVIHYIRDVLAIGYACSEIEKDCWTYSQPISIVFLSRCTLQKSSRP
jgi:hypothetical protein